MDGVLEIGFVFDKDMFTRSSCQGSMVAAGPEVERRGGRVRGTSIPQLVLILSKGNCYFPFSFQTKNKLKIKFQE